FLVGVVVAANRTIADLWRPVWRQRPSMGGLMPGTLIPGGTATRFDRFADDDEPAEQIRIHIPEEKPRAAIAVPAHARVAEAQPPKPSLPGGAQTLRARAPPPGGGPRRLSPPTTQRVSPSPYPPPGSRPPPSSPKASCTPI